MFAFRESIPPRLWVIASLVVILLLVGCFCMVGPELFAPYYLGLGIIGALLFIWMNYLAARTWHS